MAESLVLGTEVVILAFHLQRFNVKMLPENIWVWGFFFHQRQKLWFHVMKNDVFVHSF